MAMMLSDPASAGIEQFAYGKLIDGGRDVRGYTVVARSPNAPPDEWVNRIRAQADLGVAEDLSSYAGSDVAFLAGDYAIAGRFQCSPKRYDRGYFLQEHYLVLSKHIFASALGNNFAYLLALLPEAIPWRARDEQLPTLLVPARADEARRVEQMLAQYGDQALDALELALDGRPFVIVAPKSAPETVNPFLEAMGLLIPRAYRAEFAWATNVMNVRKSQARLKCVVEGNASAEGHTLVTLGAPRRSQPPTGGAAQGYISTLRLCRDRQFGVAKLLETIENIPAAPNLPLPNIAPYLAETLWKFTGPSIIEKQIATNPDNAALYESVQTMLDQPGFAVTPEQRSRFWVALVERALNGKLPDAIIARLPGYAARANAETLWADLEPVLLKSADAPRANNRWKLFAQWRETPLWTQPRLQSLVNTLLERDLAALADRPDDALTYLRQIARSRLTPVDVAAQANLLNRAIARAASPNAYRAELMLMTWAELATSAEGAIQVARAVPPLTAILFQDRRGMFNFIAHALNRADPARVEHQLATKGTPYLDSAYDLMLTLALMGERLGLAGFHAARVLAVIARDPNRAPERIADLAILLNALEKAALDAQAAAAFLTLIFAANQPARFQNLLKTNWQWIDNLVSWLHNNPPTAPGYIAALGIALQWFKDPSPAGVQPGERSARLAQLYEYVARLPRDPAYELNTLTRLMIDAALRGESAAASRAPGLIQRAADWRATPESKVENDFVRRVAAGLRAIHDALFARDSPVPPEYHHSLNQALAETWKYPNLTGKLIGALKDESLVYETDAVRRWNALQRGAEILKGIEESARTIAVEEDKLAMLLDQAEGMTREEIYRVYANRAQLSQLLIQIVAAMEQRRTELQQLQNKLR